MWKRVILAFISLFWLQRSLVFVSNIYAIYLFISLSHCTGAGVASVAMSSSLPALEVVISTTYGAASEEGARGWRPFRFSEPPYIIVPMARCVRGGSQWDQLNLTVTSICVSCRSHCYLFACYYYFMLRLFILCYICRTIALVATVICWLYPTLNKFYLILSYILSYLTPDRCFDGGLVSEKLRKLRENVEFIYGGFWMWGYGIRIFQNKTCTGESL